jgi:hypothetical protein
MFSRELTADKQRMLAQCQHDLALIAAGIEPA